MASVGSISLSINGTMDAGLALLLVNPPENAHEFQHAGAIFRLSPDTPFIVCCFSGANSHIESVNIGSSLIQEGLDILSMTGSADVATRNTNEEYVAWWNIDHENTITYVSTSTYDATVFPPQLIFHDVNGNVVPPNIIVPQHHLGFRFYRLAQVSDDLFDAYRNMYLAFEALLSSKYPKGREMEINWLRSSLTDASTDLNLLNMVSAGTQLPIDLIINIVYKNARLPLFHAKDGRAYFAPASNANDRGDVADALRLLTQIVIKMANVWFNTRRIAGGLYLKTFEGQLKTFYSNSEFVFSDNPHYSLQDELNSESIRQGYRFSAQFYEEFEGKTRCHVYGCLDVPSLQERQKLYALYVINKESPLILCSPDAILDLTGFNRFEAFIFLRLNNASQPKYWYAR